MKAVLGSWIAMTDFSIEEAQIRFQESPPVPVWQQSGPQSPGRKPGLWQQGRQLFHSDKLLLTSRASKDWKKERAAGKLGRESPCREAKHRNR